MQANDVFKALEKIAQRFLGFPTLQVQGDDSLDFHDVNVADVRDALQEAYLRGYKDGLES